MNLMKEAELLDLTDFEIRNLVAQAHKDGLSYWQLLRLFIKETHILIIQVDAERWLMRS